MADGTKGWFPLGNCTLGVRTGSPHILPPMARDSIGSCESLSGCYILVTNRMQTWMGPGQIITDKLKLFVTYQVSAWVRTGSGLTGPQNVNVALSVDNQWVNGGQVEVADDMWHEIGGSFRIERSPSKVMVYVQGPAAGVDLMVAGLLIFPVDRKARFKYLKKQTDKVISGSVVQSIIYYKFYLIIASDTCGKCSRSLAMVYVLVMLPLLWNTLQLHERRIKDSR